MENTIYFDNAATTQVLDKVAKVAIDIMTNEYYNPASSYKCAMSIEKQVNHTRKLIMNTLGVNVGKIIFTAGGSESNNIAIQGYINKTKNPTIITCATEHPSVLHTCEYLGGRENVNLVVLPVDRYGYIDMDMLANSLKNSDNCLLSIMHVNNETGTIQNLKEISTLIENTNPKCIFHVDGVQAFCKIPINLKEWNIDMYSISGHKFHTPKGVGALYINNDKLINPILYGGGQEDGMRPGTHNTSSICALGEAIRILQPNISNNYKNMIDIKKIIIDNISKNIDDFILCSDEIEKSAPHILNLAFKKIKGAVLLSAIEADGLIANTGSACSSKKQKLSPVLTAMDIPRTHIDGAIRLSFCSTSTKQEAKIASDIIIKNVKRLRRFS